MNWKTVEILFTLHFLRRLTNRMNEKYYVQRTCLTIANYLTVCPKVHVEHLRSSKDVLGKCYRLAVIDTKSFRLEQLFQTDTQVSE